MTNETRRETKIYYTFTDEAPFLATQSWLPVLSAFVSLAQIEIDSKDISLSARILANIADQDQGESKDALSFFSEIIKDKKTYIIKLPNISASVPQLKEAILELNKKGTL